MKQNPRNVILVLQDSIIVYSLTGLQIVYRVALFFPPKNSVWAT